MFKIKYEINDAVNFVIQSKTEITIEDIRKHFDCCIGTAKFLFSAVASQARKGTIPIKFIPSKKTVPRKPEILIPTQNVDQGKKNKDCCGSR